MRLSHTDTMTRTGMFKYQYETKYNQSPSNTGGAMVQHNNQKPTNSLFMSRKTVNVYINGNNNQVATNCSFKRFLS